MERHQLLDRSIKSWKKQIKIYERVKKKKQTFMENFLGMCIAALIISAYNGIVSQSYTVMFLTGICTVVLAYELHKFLVNKNKTNIFIKEVEESIKWLEEQNTANYDEALSIIKEFDINMRKVHHSIFNIEKDQSRT